MERGGKIVPPASFSASAPPNGWLVAWGALDLYFLLWHELNSLHSVLCHTCGSLDWPTTAIKKSGLLCIFHSHNKDKQLTYAVQWFIVQCHEKWSYTTTFTVFVLCIHQENIWNKYKHEIILSSCKKKIFTSAVLMKNSTWTGVTNGTGNTICLNLHMLSLDLVLSCLLRVLLATPSVVVHMI